MGSSSAADTCYPGIKTEALFWIKNVKLRHISKLSHRLDNNALLFDDLVQTWITCTLF